MARTKIGIDTSQFESNELLISWVKLSPTNKGSANKKKSVSVSKARQIIPQTATCSICFINH